MKMQTFKVVCISPEFVDGAASLPAAAPVPAWSPASTADASAETEAASSAPEEEICESGVWEESLREFIVEHPKSPSDMLAHEQSVRP